MSNSSTQSSFCQFGGHDSSIPRAAFQLKPYELLDKEFVSNWTNL